MSIRKHFNGLTVDDQTLLNAWRDGDTDQGNLLFQRHVVGISRFFRTKVPNHAEDLTQRTFLALVEGKSKFSGQSSFRSYLFGIARNQLLMQLRKQTRASHRFDPLTSSAIDVGASPAQVAACHQQQQLVLGALQQLPVDAQVALELFYYESMSLTEIADVLGEPMGTIKSRLSRGRVLLREKLEELIEPSELLRSTVNELEHWARSLSKETLAPT